MRRKARLSPAKGIGSSTMWGQEGLGLVVGNRSLVLAFLIFPSPLLVLLPPSGCGLEGQGSEAAKGRQGWKTGWEFQTLAIWEDRNFLLELKGEMEGYLMIIAAIT